MTRGAIALVVALLAAGCSDAELFDDGGDSARAEQSVVYGELSGRADDSVLKVATPLGSCTAALVAPNLVVTARHCLAKVSRADGLACNPDGTSVNNRGLITGDYDASEIVFYYGPGGDSLGGIRGKQILSTESQTVCRNDLALVVLEKSLDGWPIMPLRLLRPTLVGERMTVIGFGVTENTKQLPVRRRREGLVVEMVGPNRFSENGGQAVRGTFVVGQGPCSGDSGGPAVAESTGAIAGVYSILGAESCTEENAANVFVQLAEYDELINRAFDAVGREPWYEGEDAPGEKTASSGCSFRRSGGTTCTGAVFATVFALLRSRRRRVFEFLS